MTIESSDIMHKREASMRLYATPTTLLKWISEGKLTTVRVGKSDYITKESVLKMGTVLGIPLDDLTRGPWLDDELSPNQWQPSPIKPTVWPTFVMKNCSRCGKSTARGWCLTCSSDYD